MQSILDEIPGIGKTRKQKLLVEFGSIEAIAQSDKQELISQAQLPTNVADHIYNFFHSREFYLVRERYGIQSIDREEQCKSGM